MEEVKLAQGMSFKFYYTAQLRDVDINRLGYRAEEFDALQADLEDLGSETPGAAERFVAQMANRRRHPDREFKVQKLWAGAAVAFNSFAPKGLCCTLLLNIYNNGQVRVTASEGNDWLGIAIPDNAPKTSSLQYSFLDDKSQPPCLIEIPEKQKAFLSPPCSIRVEPGRPEPGIQKFVDWLYENGQTPESLGLVRPMQKILADALTVR